MSATTILAATVAVGVLVLVTPSHSAYATEYAFTTFDVPGGNNTAAYGVNGAGQIVGSFASNSGTGVHGFLYSGGVFTQIDAPGAEGSTQVFGANDLGQMVGIVCGCGRTSRPCPAARSAGPI
jgi:probable HAF family extracellular repeat protein